MPKQLTKEEIIEKIKVIHGDLIDYEKVKFNNNSKLISIYCNKCKSEYTLTIKNVLNGYSCPYHSIKAKQFYDLGYEKFGDRFEYITDNTSQKYNGLGVTYIPSPNAKTNILCKKHNNMFETQINDFFSNNEPCPICKFENSNFNKKKRKKNDYYYNKYNKVNIHKTCDDNELIGLIVIFIKEYTNAFGYYKYNIFINENYEIDIEIDDLNNLNKEWRGLFIYIIDGKLPKYIRFGEIITSNLIVTTVMFNRNSLEYIENLIGCPKKLYGNLYCINENLKSLVGSPEEIHGNYYVNKNKIKNLIGCPKIIYGDVDISNNSIKTKQEFNDVNCEIFGKLNRKNNLFIE